MGELTRDTVSNTARTVSSILSRWPAWAAYTAFLWSVLYGLLGLYWTLGGAGFPFGAANDPDGVALSILAGVQAETDAPVIAGLGLVGTVVALAMTRGWGRGFLRTVLFGIAWSGAIVLLLVVPDARALIAVAVTLLFLLSAPFGWVSGNILDIVSWPVLNQFLCLGGGVVWAGAAVAYQRRTLGVCGNCGRTDTGTGWTTPSVAARWGRWATYVAVIIPLLYTVTRWAWALGIPFGITEEYLHSGQASGGAALGTLAVVGALLTLGLSQRWGERFPRWLPFLAGKRVPFALVLVPVTLVAILATNAGLMAVRQTVLAITTGTLDSANWATFAPVLLWPIWGAALGAATLAYYYRRRGRCQHCGRGADRGTDSI